MVDVNTLIKDAQTAQSTGNHALALNYFQQALLQYPNEASLLIACGNLCMKLNQVELAAQHFRNLLLVNHSPDVANALCYALQAHGNQSANAGRDSIAEACFTEALQYHPKHAIFWYNLGNAQRNLGKIEAAITSFQQSIVFNPNDADAYNNLGNVQRELGQLDLAIANYEKAIALDGNMHHSLAHLIHQKQHICDWGGEGKDNLAQQILAIREIISTTPDAAIAPFAFLAMPSTTAAEQKRCANHYIAQHYIELNALRDTLAFTHYLQTKPRLKIGYLSADFRLHPLAFLITELLENHDKLQFELYAYAYGAEDKTDVRKRLVNAFDHFVDIRPLDDVEAATKINQDQIDILVDLTGYTQSSRTGIAVLKPAPIQINWLGFAGTMGEFAEHAPLFDYLLADKIIAPHQADFSEKLLYLPCYQPNNKRACAQTSAKADHGLPNDSFVFCCFNQTFKITPDVFAVWMRLLKQVPTSVLWLLACNPWAKANLEKEAESAGVDKRRLIFAARVSSETHMERQQHADLFLDTMPYNAHTTASDALAVGLPILTCKGDTFASRVTASLLNHIEMPALICDTLTAYEEKALYFAQHAQALTEIKAELKHKIQSTDLFNAKKFAASLERQYLAIWQDACKNSSH
jgi:predicted O-linked N-acetylglucosamine transferase (SPINDLY family)